MKHSEKPRRVVPFGKTPKTLLHQIRCAPLLQRKAVVAFVPFSTPKPWKIQPVLATVKIGEAAPIHRTVQPARPPVVTFALSSPTMVSEVPESTPVCEIGRSSWREWRCQYVSIWVVAVTQHKQHH